MPFLAPALLALLATSPSGSAPADRAKVRLRLEDERAVASVLAEREASLLGRLADLERQIELEGGSLRAEQAKLRSANLRLRKSEAQIRSAEAACAAAAEALTPRIVARYRLGREGYLRFLLGARSIAELFRRRRLFDEILRQDFEGLRALGEKTAEANAARAELAEARAEQARLVSDEAERRSRLRESLDAQRHFLASVQEERAVHERAVRELTEATRALDSELSGLEASRGPPAAAVSLRKAKGSLPFPVDYGQVDVHFGRARDPRFRTVLVQKGLDVRAAAGTPVRAIGAGRVAFASWFRGYGNLLVIDHGDGLFSLMAHLATLQKAVSEPVLQGEVVGTVGDSGSLKGTYLYFELRDGQTAVDPEKWLARPRHGPQLLAGAGEPEDSTE